MTAQDRDDLLAANFDDAELTAAVGAIEPFGEAGFSTLERIWLRPTLEIVGLGGGFAGEGIKTVIPAKAVAKLAARLVPDQDPNEILTLIEAHIEAHHPAACNVTLRELGFKAKPYITDRAGAVNAAVARVLREMTGAEPQYPRRGATIPALAAFQKHLGVETTPFAFALPGDGAHAPDEHYSLAQYATAREAYARVLLELGADAASGKLVKRKAGGADSERRSGHTEL